MNIVDKSIELLKWYYKKYIGFLKWFYKKFLYGISDQTTGTDDCQKTIDSIYTHWADDESIRLYRILISIKKYLETDDYSKDIEELIRPCLDFGPTLKLPTTSLYIPIATPIALFFIAHMLLPFPLSAAMAIVAVACTIPAFSALVEQREVNRLITSVSTKLVEYDWYKDTNLRPLPHQENKVFIQWLTDNFKFFSKHKYLDLSGLYSGNMTLKSNDQEFHTFYIKIQKRHKGKNGNATYETIDSFFGIRVPGLDMTEMRICSQKQNEDDLQPWTSLSPGFNERYCCEVADSIVAAKWLTPLTLEEILNADMKLGELEIMTSKDGYFLALFKKDLFFEKPRISTTLKTPSAFLNELLAADQSSENLTTALSLIDTIVSQ
ncbi:hypothetical protein [Gynuella sunshinyii]|uniref:Uncharacterized protein n=1 Tax=Gynuella sunshinyii YC6258 TaxID=1445510 RepID=A0A0C5VN62_9GAMM|nr:hypothetical protein [Gynuella sunshinyii]AJQ94768.1 hypothetical Protein YC6258_02730 [Gynuella sunshinyii YC6258]